MAEENGNSNEPQHYVLNAEPGKFEVSIGLVTSLSTTSNATFESIAHLFARRITEKAAEIFAEENKRELDSKGS